MAGKRQHYVPRLLQRGFLHNPLERAERTWLYRRGEQPRLVGIGDVGVEDYFYSRPSNDGSPTLDDLIKNLEGGELGSSINRMRGAPIGEIVDPTLAAAVVVHLVTRTAHIRKVVSHLLADVVDRATARFTEPGFLGALMGLDNIEPSALFVQAIKEFLDKQPKQLEIPSPLIERILYFGAREHADQLMVSRPAFLSEVDAVIDELPKRVRDAHNSAVALSSSDNVWIDELSGYEWRIEATTEAILSDCVAIISEANNSFVPFLLANRQSAQGAILPLSSGKLLVGRKYSYTSIELARYNAEAAACSESFFIFAKEAEGSELADLIGTRLGRAIDDLTSKTFADFEVRAISKPSDHSMPIEVPSSWKPQDFSYGVRLADFGDEVLAAEVGAVVKILTQELSRHLPLHDLDGLTFAIDFPRALHSLERGDVNLPPAKSKSRGYGRSVAKVVEVVRDCRRKSHVVVHADIVLGLLSEDAAQRRTAIGVLVKMLAYVAHGTLHEEAFNEYGPPDVMSWHLRPAVMEMPSKYFAGKFSAVASDSAAEMAAQLFLEGLAFAKTEIQKARLAYRTTGDLNQLLGIAMPLVSNLLEHAAEWLGHRDGMPDGEKFSGGDLPQHLRAEGFESWLELLGRDLRAVYVGEGGRPRPERVYVLDRHVERLLWMFQIFPWPMPEGGMYVSVPYGNDLGLLGLK